MLHEDDDPLSSSMFDSTSDSILGNTLTTSMFSSQYEQDPWGNHTAASMTQSTRSFTSPNLNYEHTPLFDATNVLGKNTLHIIFIFIFILIFYFLLLAGVRLPNMYEQLFSTSQRSGRVSLSSLTNILSKGKISANHIEMVIIIILFYTP